MADTLTEKFKHVDSECDGEFIELHRIDPEESRPPLGHWELDEDNKRVWMPELDDDGEQKVGTRKYKNKVIVFYCPKCGTKVEEPWK